MKHIPVLVILFPLCGGRVKRGWLRRSFPNSAERLIRISVKGYADFFRISSPAVIAGLLMRRCRPKGRRLRRVGAVAVALFRFRAALSPI